MKERFHLTSKELHLISAYLDGELSGKELVRVEQMFEKNSAARSAMERMRGVKGMLKMLPTHPVPHNFTITRQEARSYQSPLMVKVMRFTSAVSAALLAAVLAIDLILPFGTEAISMEMAGPEPELFAEEAYESGVEEGAPIIEFHPDVPEGYGRGGGVGADDTVEESDDMLLPDAVLPPGELPADQITMESVEDQEGLEDKGIGEAPESQREEKGPILGIQPDAEQGSVEAGDEYLAPVVKIPGISAMRWVEIALGGITLIATCLSFVFRKGKG